jgi:hypothetical protein
VNLEAAAMYTELYIDGRWREGAAKERFDVVNPARPRPNSRVTRGHLEARRDFGGGPHVSKAL